MVKQVYIKCPENQISHVILFSMSIIIENEHITVQWLERFCCGVCVFLSVIRR